MRLTSGGKFIPEIDGLRFIAIVSVVFYHINNFFLKHHIPETYSGGYKETHIYFLLKQGHLGVPIFFIISGFILAIPFIKIFNQKKGELNLKKYFYRRLTRLEPPYVLLMLLLFVFTVWGTKTLSFQEGLKSLGCSLAYIHNFVYGLDTLPLLNGVAWSLEIEVQFYLLAPLLSTVFLIQNTKLRRGIIILTGLTFSILNNTIRLPFLSLFDYLEFFAVGFLLADLYLNKTEKKALKIPFSTLLNLLILYVVFIIEPIQGPIIKYITDFAQLLLLFVFFYGVLFYNSFPAMRFRFITNVGGMCYTIYLLHTYIISLSGNIITSVQLSSYYAIDLTIYAVLIFVVVLAISSIYFLLIERPCMDKDWPIKLKNRMLGKAKNS